MTQNEAENHKTFFLNKLNSYKFRLTTRSLLIGTTLPRVTLLSLMNHKQR